MILDVLILEFDSSIKGINLKRLISRPIQIIRGSGALSVRTIPIFIIKKNKSFE